MTSKILIVEDDKDIAQLIHMHLKEEGYEVEVVSRGDTALERLGKVDYNALVLDLMLPGLSGLDICRKLRERKSRIPILMLTSRSEEIDKVLGLELGADDYLAKPFGIRELSARLKALLRRSTGESSNVSKESQTKTLTFGKLIIDPARRRVMIGDQLLELTAKEYDLLYYLASFAGRPFTREQLLNSVWGYQYAGYDHTVNSHINRLRNKIEPDPANPIFVITVRGVGYRFSEPAEIK